MPVVSRALLATLGVFVVNLDGSGLRRVAQHGESPAWSPNGKQLAFVYTHSVHGKPVNDWQVVGSDGTDLREIVRLPSTGDPVAPIWKP